MNTPSDTEIKIHNFADNISTALRTCFTTNRLDDYFSIPSDQNQQGAQSGEIVTALGASIDWNQRPDTGAIVATSYNFTTTVKLRTQRPSDGPSGLVQAILSQHQQDAALILTLCDINEQGTDMNTTVRGPLGIENLPLYSVKFFNLQSCVPYVDWDYMQDVMEITWNGQLSILPTAWA
jgi:hypothetical protein